jgi:hypothetical protein
VWSDAGLVEELRREFAGEGLDLVCELAFFGLQLQHASSDRAEGEHAPNVEHRNRVMPATSGGGKARVYGREFAVGWTQRVSL